MIRPDDIIQSAKKINRVMLDDNKNGKNWHYDNVHRSGPTFKATRQEGKYFTNCMGGVTFVFKDAGISGYALDFYGGKSKIVWLNGGAKDRTKKVFDILRVNRTVRSAVKKGIIQPGDIITYVSMIHTNIYYGNDKSFDSGHAYCTGEHFNKWIGSLAHANKKCKYVLRLKHPATYRVQVGAYEQMDNAEKRIAEIVQKSGFNCFREQTDLIRVYCGSFEQAQNAIDRINELEADGFKDAFIVVKG